jgi:hypothetical protein
MSKKIDMAESPNIRIPADFKEMMFTGMPEGAHRASLHSIRTTQTRNGLKGFKVNWLLDGKPEDQCSYMASSTFTGEGVKLLIASLRSWLGSDFDKYIVEGQIKIEELKGLKADVLVKYIDTGTHPEPLCRVTKFTAPGGLIKRTPTPGSPQEQLYHSLNSLN